MIVDVSRNEIWTKEMRKPLPQRKLQIASNTETEVWDREVTGLSNFYRGRNEETLGR
jgi:hypothetical protein